LVTLLEGNVVDGGRVLYIGERERERERERRGARGEREGGRERERELVS
jgi:hypothetical protein